VGKLHRQELREIRSRSTLRTILTVHWAAALAVRPLDKGRMALCVPCALSADSDNSDGVTAIRPPVSRLRGIPSSPQKIARRGALPEPPRLPRSNLSPRVQHGMDTFRNLCLSIYRGRTPAKDSAEEAGKNLTSCRQSSIIMSEFWPTQGLLLNCKICYYFEIWHAFITKCNASCRNREHSRPQPSTLRGCGARSTIAVCPEKAISPYPGNQQEPQPHTLADFLR